MIDVGYDMYLKLLEEAVLEERGEKPEQRAECAADLAVSANIPESYVPSQEQRMDLYRRIALVRTEAEADDLMDEVIDRFGDPPPSVYTLVQVALLRADAGKVGVTDISAEKRLFEVSAGAVRYAEGIGTVRPAGVQGPLEGGCGGKAGRHSAPQDPHPRHRTGKSVCFRMGRRPGRPRMTPMCNETKGSVC